MQRTMAASLASITADQISIGTYQVCNNSLKSLSYMTAMTNLTTPLFRKTLKNLTRSIRQEKDTLYK